MKPLRLIRTTTIKLAFYILAENDKKCTLFDYICFRDVKHKLLVPQIELKLHGKSVKERF